MCPSATGVPCGGGCVCARGVALWSCPVRAVPRPLNTFCDGVGVWWAVCAANSAVPRITRPSAGSLPSGCRASKGQEGDGCVPGETPRAIRLRRKGPLLSRCAQLVRQVRQCSSGAAAGTRTAGHLPLLRAPPGAQQPRACLVGAGGRAASCFILRCCTRVRCRAGTPLCVIVV